MDSASLSVGSSAIDKPAANQNPIDRGLLVGAGLVPARGPPTATAGGAYIGFYVCATGKRSRHPVHRQNGPILQRIATDGAFLSVGFSAKHKPKFNQNPIGRGYCW